MKGADQTLPATGWIRERKLLAFVPFGRTKLRQEIDAGRFPAPLRFGPRMKAFEAVEVHRWLADPFSWVSSHGGSAAVGDKVHQHRYKSQSAAPAQRRRVRII